MKCSTLTAQESSCPTSARSWYEIFRSTYAPGHSYRKLDALRADHGETLTMKSSTRWPHKAKQNPRSRLTSNQETDLSIRHSAIATRPGRRRQTSGPHHNLLIRQTVLWSLADSAGTDCLPSDTPEDC